MVGPEGSHVYTRSKWWLAVVALTGITALGAESVKPPRQYTFAWPFSDDAMAPRGGSTHGDPVVLRPDIRDEFRRIHEPGISALERDRRAILAMAGEYRATFDFIEVAGFRAGFAPDRPYQSWGTEKIYAVKDAERFISLQHLLVMRIVDKDGTVQGPFVMRHWRQDWSYEPKERLVYRGQNTWERIALADAERRGAWVQSVWQVDGSPRYSGVGRWQHLGNYSTWASGEEWRPLPRREFNVRNDYQVLSGTNRHSITPTGWIQEELNLKLALDERGHPIADGPVVAREFGLNRYETISGFDWSPGDRYLARTAPLWEAVHAEWDARIARGKVTLKAQPDQAQLFGPLFEYADALDSGETRTTHDIREFARSAVASYLAAPGAQ